VKVNVQGAALTVPDAVKNAGMPKVTVTSSQLAPGIWLLAGGSHNSVAVEFKDFAAIIEAPLDDARTLAVIAETKRLIPEQADQIRRQHASSLGPCGRLARGLRGRRHHRHQRAEQELL
jgi:hypothetical protein